MWNQGQYSDIWAWAEIFHLWSLGLKNIFTNDFMMSEVSQDCSEPAWRQRLNHSMSCRDRIAALMALTTFHTCCSPGDFLPLRTVKAVIEGRVWWRLISFSRFSFWETRLVTSERSKGSEWEKKESLRGWRGQCSDSGWTSKLYSLERKRSRRHRALEET